MAMALMDHNEDAVQEVFSFPQDQVQWSWTDASGRTLLHYAARELHVEAVERLLALEPESAVVRTLPGARPGLWTPLHCVTDLGVHDEDEKVRQARIVEMLLDSMSDEAIACVNDRRSNALHLIAGKGLMHLLPAFRGRGAVVLQMLQAKNERAPVVKPQ